MSYKVIDTNVLLVASGLQNAVPHCCTLRAMRFIRTFWEHYRLSLDNGWQILHEWQQRIQDYQDSIGYEFFCDACQRSHDEEYAEAVDIEEAESHPRYLAILDDWEIRGGFDQNDRKFVKVAICSLNSPTICNSSDPDWNEQADTFAKHNIMIEELCPEFIV
jgi:hypothetical protein